MSGHQHEGADDARTPWLPAGLAEHGLDLRAVQALSYLVVEEMVDDVATVTVSPWPAADRRGRLRFDLEGADEFAVALADLRSQIYEGWLTRAPRVGDVFAAEVDRERLQAPEARGVWNHPLDQLVAGPVYDLSVEARKVAKLAYYAAVTETLSAAQAHEYRMDERVERDEPIPVRRGVGSRSGEGGS